MIWGVWSIMGVVNYMCVSCNTEKQSKAKVSQGQLTLFGERASSDTDNLGKS